MINIILKKDNPELFKGVLDYAVENSMYDHRQGSNFYTKTIVEFKEDDGKPYSEFIGTWETNTYVSDAEYGKYGNDDESIELLRKVEKIKETVEINKWKPITN